MALTRHLMAAAFSLVLPCLVGSMAVHAQSANASDVTADMRMMQEAAPMRQAADRFVASASSGDLEATLSMLSRALVDRSGEATIRRVLQAQILPFFAQGRELGRSVTVARTTDGVGSQGFAFYLWLVPADGGAPRPFSLYVVQEQGRPVVANIVPDRLVEGRHSPVASR